MGNCFFRRFDRLCRIVHGVGLLIIFAGFTAYMGYIGASELGTNSEFVKLFGGMIGFFIGLWMGKLVRKMLVGALE